MEKSLTLALYLIRKKLGVVMNETPVSTLSFSTSSSKEVYASSQCGKHYL
jgi:hypothetical protein